MNARCTHFMLREAVLQFVARKSARYFVRLLFGHGQTIKPMVNTSHMMKLMCGCLSWTRENHCLAEKNPAAVRRTAKSIHDSTNAAWWRRL
jgi:hypothetical protein